MRRAIDVQALVSIAEQARDILSEDDEQAREIGSAIDEPIVLVDEDDRIIFSNSSAERLFAYSRQELRGKDFPLLRPVQYRKTALREFQSVLIRHEGRSVRKVIELQGCRKDGTEFPLELSVVTWKTQGGCYRSVVCHITEHQARKASAYLTDATSGFSSGAEHRSRLRKTNWCLEGTTTACRSVKGKGLMTCRG